MNSEDRLMAFVVGSIAITIIAIAVCVLSYNITVDKAALAAGLVQKQNVGATGAHWTKP